ncbi:hypothetical protein CDAR_240881 [Caerostris darwini]|uniref:Uncharacterized protein n=1 Tax=Caerostris darwini TaxID=1538125 RepID=A0AAV4THH7_9ARAC|nr:hypothetical protein CDAR_240881 [Caerostris darwini]
MGMERKCCYSTPFKNHNHNSLHQLYEQLHGIIKINIPTSKIKRNREKSRLHSICQPPINPKHQKSNHPISCPPPTVQAIQRDATPLALPTAMSLQLQTNSGCIPIVPTKLQITIEPAIELSRLARACSHAGPGP